MAEWRQTEQKAKPWTGRHVEVLLVNGYTVEGHLTGVGYEGLRLLRAGESVESYIAGRLVVDVVRQETDDG